ISVIHLDCIVCTPSDWGVWKFTYSKRFKLPQSLDAFLSFYVNKFIDHHAFSIAF
ncbi:hypothetical protein BJV74DRAFT_791967, partial [Russula compacta]